jgi:signal transduction histidine kinase
MATLRGTMRQVGLLRSLVEGTAFAFLCLIVLQRAHLSTSDQVILALVTLVSAATGVIAIRLRRFDPSFGGILAEMGCAIVAATWVATLQFLYLMHEYRHAYPYSAQWIAMLFGLLDSAVYLVIRFVIVGIPWWLRFQRRKLRWQLVNLQLLVVVVLIVVPMTVIGAIGVWGTSNSLPIRNQPTDNALLGIVSGLVFAAAVTVVLLAVAFAGVLPPSIVISYFAARRTTRRLERLAGTAAALRDGQLDARVDVQGEDEVAQLQGDVNAMAGTMQRTIAELETERDRVRGLLQQRQELIASVSHELRTPVSIMRGYLDAALEREGELSESFRRDLDVMHRESIRLQRLIDDLFALSRTAVEGLSLRIEPVDVVGLLRQCVAATAPGAWQSSRVDVLMEPGEELPPAAVDPDRLQQIVLNVISNGIRHSPPGGLVVVSAVREGERIAIRIADTGEGIAAEEIGRIWERFYRGSNARDPRGSGLGLALAKELTEAMGGEVGVASIPGEETVFTFWFPVATDEDVLLRPAAAGEPATPAQLAAPALLDR